MLLQLLQQAADDDGPGGGRQAAQFVERIGADPRPLGQGDADEDGPLLADRHFGAGEFHGGIIPE